MKYLQQGLDIVLTDSTINELNPYFKSPENHFALETMRCQCGSRAFVEPFCAGTGNIYHIKDDKYLKDVILNLCPWSTNFEKCDGLTISKQLLRRENLALLARSYDNLMIALQDDDTVIIINAGIPSINNGILKNLPKLHGKISVLFGSCIGEKYLTYDKENAAKFSNFSSYGYLSYVKEEDSVFHINIKAICLSEIESTYDNLYIINDPRDTYECKHLASYRRDGADHKANCMFIY